FQPPSKSRKADDVAAGLANVELRRSVESLVARLDHRRAAYGLFDLVEIADRRHRDEQCGAVTRKVVCLVWTLGDDARGRLIHDLDAVLLQDREDELPIVARHLTRFAEAQLVDPELNTGLDGVHSETRTARTQR